MSDYLLSPFSSTSPSSAPMSLAGSKTHTPVPGATPEPAKRRGSSISSPSGPWARRNSFLSRDMLLDENFSVYESHSIFTSSGYTKYNVISLRESQGFVFNQDLFASPYQQSRSLMTEKKYNAFNSCSSKSRSPSVGSSSSPACSRRRHTSYNETRPTFLKEPISNRTRGELENEQMEIDSAVVHEEQEPEEDAMESNDSSSQEEGDDYEDSTNNSIYRVKVTDIILDEKDTLIYPS